MSATPGEIALGRVLAYLRLSRMPIDREAMLEALTLVQEALREEEGLEPLLQALIRRLPERFSLPDPPLPTPCPPLRRGSLQYDD